MTTNDNNKTEIGLAALDDLPELLGLYRFLNSDDPVLEVDGAVPDHWDAILNNPALHYIVARAEGKVVGTCALTIIPCEACSMWAEERAGSCVGYSFAP